MLNSSKAKWTFMKSSLDEGGPEWRAKEISELEKKIKKVKARQIKGKSFLDREADKWVQREELEKLVSQKKEVSEHHSAMELMSAEITKQIDNEILQELLGLANNPKPAPPKPQVQHLLNTHLPVYSFILENVWEKPKTNIILPDDDLIITNSIIEYLINDKQT